MLSNAILWNNNFIFHNFDKHNTTKRTLSIIKKNHQNPMWHVANDFNNLVVSDEHTVLSHINIDESIGCLSAFHRVHTRRCTQIVCPFSNSLECVPALLVCVCMSECVYMHSRLGCPINSNRNHLTNYFRQWHTQQIFVFKFDKYLPR